MNHVEAVQAVPMKSSRGGCEFLLLSLEASDAEVETWSGWPPSSSNWLSSPSSTFCIGYIELAGACLDRLERWDELLLPIAGRGLDVYDMVVSIGASGLLLYQSKRVVEQRLRYGYGDGV